MRSIVTIVALAVGVLACDAWFQSSLGQSSGGAPGTDLSAPPRSAPRARTRIRVTPSYYPYRTFSTTYPVPYPIEYPGPGFVRQCTSWLATESRVSGPVVVPRQRCWWQRG
ncbi:MAG: hypothetical protein IT537_00160 [Hyphomicrobiales bacterium]|nr:hypothetical protein [Hyphomicrobiales bacterium]